MKYAGKEFVKNGDVSSNLNEVKRAVQNLIVGGLRDPDQIERLAIGLLHNPDPELRVNGVEVGRLSRIDGESIDNANAVVGAANGIASLLRGTGSSGSLRLLGYMSFIVDARNVAIDFYNNDPGRGISSFKLAYTVATGVAIDSAAGAARTVYGPKVSVGVAGFLTMAGTGVGMVIDAVGTDYSLTRSISHMNYTVKNAVNQAISENKAIMMGINSMTKRWNELGCSKYARQL